MSSWGRVGCNGGIGKVADGEGFVKVVLVDSKCRTKQN